MTTETQQSYASDIWLTPGIMSGADVRWTENGINHRENCVSRDEALRLIHQKWTEACERSLPYLSAKVDELLGAAAEEPVAMLQVQKAQPKQHEPPLGQVEADVWIRRGCAGGSADLCWRTGQQSYSTSVSFRGQAMDIVRSHRTPACRRSLEEIEAEVNELLPPQEHSDGDVWVTKGMNGSCVYVHWQQRWQSYNTSAYCRGQAMDIVRSHRTPACRRTLEEIEAEVNELLPPQEHPDGDVWVTKGMNSSCVYVHWQQRWQSYNTSAYCRGQALEIARSHWTPACSRTLEQIEAAINALLPAQRHADGDRWIEQSFGSWRKCWQSGWSEYHQQAVSKEDAERWLASGR